MTTTWKPNSSMTMPFGQYKGQPTHWIKKDPDYVAWLKRQPWFVLKYPDVYECLTDEPVPSVEPKRRPHQQQRVKAEPVDGGSIVIPFPRNRIVRIPEPPEAA